MTKKIDHLGHDYPSEKGAMAQLLDKIHYVDAEESWYSFDVGDLESQGTAYVTATSFDDDGEADEVYYFKISVMDQP